MRSSSYVLDDNREQENLVIEQESSVQNKNLFYMIQLFKLFMKNEDEFGDFISQDFEPNMFCENDYNVARERARADWKVFSGSVRAIKQMQNALSHRRACSPIARDRDCVTISRMGDYYVGNAFSKGSAGLVSVGVDSRSNELVAIKQIDKDKFNGHRIRGQLQQETNIFKKINHPNLITLREVTEFPTHVTLCMDYAAKGDLLSHMRDFPGGLAEKDASHIFKQVCHAIHYLHTELFVVHRDIKPENILLDDLNQVKIVDFGVAAFWKKADGTDEVFNGICGTSFYMAPEVIACEDYIGPPVDIWSMGVLLFGILTGRLPFKADDFVELKNKICACAYAMPQHISKEAMAALRQMLVRKGRPNIDQVLKLPWVVADLPVFSSSSRSNGQHPLEVLSVNTKRESWLENTHSAPVQQNSEPEDQELIKHVCSTPPGNQENFPIKKEIH